MVVRKIAPSVSVRTIVLANRSPRSLANIRSPPSPTLVFLRILEKSLGFKRLLGQVVLSKCENRAKRNKRTWNRIPKWFFASHLTMIELLVLRPVESLFFKLSIMIIRPDCKNRSRRRLTLEKLEGRSLMAGMPGFHNISMPLDVDNDLQISPLDALVVINQINSSIGIG